MTTQAELPKYKSHKEVWALKVSGVEIHEDGSATVAASGDGFLPITTKPEWAERFKGDESDLGYYVRYPDGYESWSPTKAFEEGYTRI